MTSKYMNNHNNYNNNYNNSNNGNNNNNSNNNITLDIISLINYIEKIAPKPINHDDNFIFANQLNDDDNYIFNPCKLNEKLNILPCLGARNKLLFEAYSNNIFRVNYGGDYLSAII